MKVLYQPTLDRAQDWISIQADAFQYSPKRPPPIGRETLDGQPGWVYGLNIQGVCFHGYDHYAVQDGFGESCIVTAWKDDAGDMPDGEFYARQVIFHPLGPDPHLGGALNTRQETTLFAAPAVYARFLALSEVQNTILRPWEEFIRPSPRYVRHGIWTPDDLAEAHMAIRSRHGWREWSWGRDPVPQQRRLGLYNKPRGTKTVYQRDTVLLTGIHVASDEVELNATPGTGQILTHNLGGGESVLTCAFSSLAGFPDDAAWPAGDYRCQLDVLDAGADVTYGLMTAGGVTGHFGRVNSGLTSDLETKAQIEGLFSGTGLKLATTGSVSWSTGAVTDRLEILIAVTRASSHGNQAFDLTMDSDAFVDGPWVNQEVISITKVGLQFTGKTVGVNAKVFLSVTKAALQWTGQTVVVNSIVVIQITKAALAWTGKTVGVNAKEFIAVTAAALDFTGQAVMVNAKTFIAITAAALDWTGKALAARNATIINIAKAAMGWAGQALVVNAKQVLVITKAGFDWTGRAVTAKNIFLIQITKAGLQWTGRQVTVNAVFVVQITKAGLAWSGQALVVNAKEFIEIAAGALAWTGKVLTVNAVVVLQVGKTVLQWTGNGILIGGQEIVVIGRASLTWAGGNINALFTPEGVLAHPLFSVTYRNIVAVLKWSWQRSKPDSKKQK